MGYERLEKSLIDLVKEEQAKLGYRKEMIRLYYPLSSLNHFMETNADSEEMQELLADFRKQQKIFSGKSGLHMQRTVFALLYRKKHRNMCMKI